MNKLSTLICAAALAFSTAVSASPLISGFNQTFLPADDDNSRQVGMAGGWTLGLNGSNYTSLWVNNNGNVSFGGAQSAFAPNAFNSSYALNFLAPFFSDVDTRINNGQAVDSHGKVGYGTTTFGGRNAFAVTWDGVGYFDHRNDKKNTFQLVLVDRTDTGAGNFDFYYNYGALQWDKAGNSNARAGYSLTGTGADFEFDGSGANGKLIDGGSKALGIGSNVGMTGRYGFNVRGGVVAQGIPPVRSGANELPLPGSLALLGIGALALGFARRRKA